MKNLNPNLRSFLLNGLGYTAGAVVGFLFIYLAGAVGLAAAVEYLSSIDRVAAAAHEDKLLQQALSEVAAIPGFRRIGNPSNCASILSFMLDGCHPSDVGMLLDEQGIAVRTGHHCTQPLMSRFDVPGTVRASFAMYNTEDDVQRLVDGLRKAQQLFA